MCNRIGRCIAGGWLVLLATAGAVLAETPDESIPDPARLVAIEAFPASIELTGKFDYAQLLLTGRLVDGQQVDVTRIARRQSDDGPALVSSRGIVRGGTDGTGSLRFTVGDHSVTVPVTVRGMDQPVHVDYIRDVSPAMSKLGCNAGTCHGAKDGKNGFKLSLRGYDPVFDHRALTDDLAGRRFNRSAPDNSLMLLKPSGGVPHVGGVVTRPGEPFYELLRTWIAAGVEFNPDTPRVTAIEIFPKNPELPLPGVKQQLRVVATYADAAQRDVTAEAIIDSSLPEVFTVDDQGLVSAVRRGEAAALVRYEGAYAATTVVVMGDRTGYQWQPVATHNHVDELVYAKLQKAKILPSGLCTDAEFLRRVYLDLTGLPPTADQTREFLADARSTRVKRDEMIDRLIGSPEYIDFWTHKWADLLQVNRKFLGEEGAWAMRRWISQAIATNMPYDEFAYQVLTASGSTLDNPPASYYKVLRNPGDLVENSTQLFLAIRFNCNKCHDHPFERWTQDQYYHLASYFAQVGRKDAPKYADNKLGGTAVERALASVEVIYDSGSGEVTHERTGQTTTPAFPFTHDDLAGEDASRRQQLARWVTSPKNEYFAKSYVNRVFSYLLGVGIIDPVDDIRAGNPPTNPELLQRLTDDFIASGFDVRELIRTICRSRVYQHSVVTNRWNEDDNINFSHALARRLPAETLYNAVHHACGTVTRLPGVPDGFTANQLPDASAKLADGFLDLFGRPARESACECERSTGVMLGQMLNLVNGPTIAKAIAADDNGIARIVARHEDDSRVVEELFLSILNRPPTAAETKLGVESLRAGIEERKRITEAVADYVQNELPEKQKAWEADQAAAQWTALDVESAVSSGGAMIERQPDGSLLVAGDKPATDTYRVIARAPLAGITALRLEVLPDERLPANGPGRAGNGNFVLNEFTVKVSAADDATEAVAIKLENSQADFSQASWHVSGAVDGNRQTGWAVAPKFGVTHTALFNTSAEVSIDQGSVLEFSLDQQFGGEHTIGRFRLSVTDAGRPVRLEGPPGNIAAILATPARERTPEQSEALAGFYRPLDAELARLEKELAAVGDDPRQSRLLGAQDLAWALLNSPAFLFNR